MGVPKFYRWISERYPCLSEVVKEYQVPEFDNLYLDMNGIIHTCSHPNDDDPHFRITEEQIFQDIFRYIEVLFRIIRPQKTFFMAVDGVAPRAKMNQQRGRRFRSAKEAEASIQEALRKGETLPTEKRFDSNCITPGTHFMERLQTQLEYFVKTKVTHDRSWQGVKVYLSGHQTPGEGEHKIMEFIRHERSQPEYDPNTRHCLYGLDADLIMLGLCTHDPHFSLLREEVKFTRSKKNARTARAEETTFHLLHISLLREYIGHEFQQLKESLPFPFDLESVIDDWILMGFLVGNDFIPHLPDLHIAQNALPFLYQTYIKVMPQLGGYLNEKGTINLPRFQAFLEAISSYDIEHFEELYSDYKWLESKSQLNKAAREEAAAANPKAHLQEQEAQAKSIQIVKDLAVQQGLMTPSEGSRTPDDYDSDEDTFHQEFRLHKKSYYETKFKIKASREAIARIAYEYILGLQWICHYYYNGVQSWSWYYPYHYSPYMSDLKEVPGMKLKLKLSKPFLPFQQLLAVLPAASKECVPEPYWRLMEEENSPIGDFYPKKFLTDLNGKQQDWEAVVLIPFIDESRLLEAMLPCTQKLDASEKRRNLPGPCLLYEHDPNQSYHAKSSLPNAFPDIEACTARLTTITQQKWIKKDFRQYVKGLLPDCRLSVYYQGFPTLYHLHHRAYLKKAGVKVFQGMSRGENMILAIEKPRPNTEEKNYSLYEENVEVVADKLLGNSVYVNWPHMEEAKVVAVCDGKVKFTLREQVSGSRGSKHKLMRKELNRKEEEEFAGDVHDIHEKCLYQRGIEVGRSRTLVYAQLLQGRKYVCGKRGEITLEKQWSGTTTPFCLQSIIKDISVKDPTFKKLQSITELYPSGGEVFNLGVPNYGCYGKIVQAREGQAVVKFTVPAEPDLSNVANQMKKSSTYQPGWRVAASVGISSFLLSRITGSIYIFYPATRKWNVGLNLRFSKDGAGIAGFTKKAEQTWLYSDNVTAVLNDYLVKYPEVFTYLERNLQNAKENQLNAEDMFGSELVTTKLQELAKWLKSQPCYDGQRVYESSDVVEPSIIKAVDTAVQKFKERKVAAEEIEVGVRPQFLHRPLTQQGTLVPDKNAQHHLLDRVVNVRDGYTVPLANRGTIIGIHSESKKNKDTMLDVLFDQEFLGGLTLGGRCPNGRGYKMPVCAVVNLSYGERLLNKGTKPVAVVHPHHQTGNSHKPHHTSPGPNLGQGRLVQSQHSAFRPASKHQHQQQNKPVQLLRRGENVTSPQKQEQSQVKTVADSGSSFEQMWNSLMLSNRTPPTGHTPEKNSPKNRESKRPQKQVTKQNDASSPKTPFSLSAAAKSLPDVAAYPVGVQSNSQPSDNNKALPPFTTRNMPNSTAEAAPTTALSTNNSNNSFSTKQQSSTDEQQLAAKLLKDSLKVGNVNNPSSKTNTSDTLPEDRASLEKLLNNLQLTNVGIPPPVFPPAFVPQTGPIQFERLIASGRPPLASGRLPIVTASVPPLMTPENFVLRPSVPQQGIRTRFFSQQNQGSPNQQVQRATASNQRQDRTAFLKEGTEKLCEILSVSSQDEKLKDDTTESRTAWSAVSDDVQTKRESDRTNHETNISTQEIKSDVTKKDLSDDEDVVRSTSVEDGRSAVQHDSSNQTKVEQLLTWCRIRNLYSPIYTYTDSTQEKGKYQATVTLWNGARFQSPLVPSKEQATEEAAAVALNLLNNPPNMTAAHAPGFRGFPPPGYPLPPGQVMFTPQQFYRAETPGNPLYQQPYVHGFVPGMFSAGQPPPAPQHHPGAYLPPSQVIPLPVNYMSMGGEPPVMLPGYPYPPQTHSHPFVLNPGMYHPAAGLRMPVSIATTNHQQPAASANPQRSMYIVADNTFIPPQVMKMQLTQGNPPMPPSPPKPAPQYILSDSPSPNPEEVSRVKVDVTRNSTTSSSGNSNSRQKSDRNSRHKSSEGKKQKPKLAISFAAVSK